MATNKIEDIIKVLSLQFSDEPLGYCQGEFDWCHKVEI